MCFHTRVSALYCNVQSYDVIITSTLFSCLSSFVIIDAQPFAVVGTKRPHENIPRLIFSRRYKILCETPLSVFCNDFCDIARVHWSPQTKPATIVYVDDAGLGIETSLYSSSDCQCLIIVSMKAVKSFSIAYPTQGDIIISSTLLPLSPA